MNVLEAARINDVKRIVHAGSAEVYGKPETVPIEENHPLEPRSPYAAGKVASDRLMFAYYCTYDLPVVMSRFFWNIWTTTKYRKSNSKVYFTNT